MSGKRKMNQWMDWQLTGRGTAEREKRPPSTGTPGPAPTGPIRCCAAYLRPQRSFSRPTTRGWLPCQVNELANAQLVIRELR